MDGIVGIGGGSCNDGMEAWASKKVADVLFLSRSLFDEDLVPTLPGLFPETPTVLSRFPKSIKPFAPAAVLSTVLTDVTPASSSSRSDYDMLVQSPNDGCVYNAHSVDRGNFFS